MIGWLNLREEKYFSASFVVLGIGLTVTRGTL